MGCLVVPLPRPRPRPLPVFSPGPGLREDIAITTIGQAKARRKHHVTVDVLNTIYDETSYYNTTSQYAYCVLSICLPPSFFFLQVFKAFADPPPFWKC